MKKLEELNALINQCESSQLELKEGTDKDDLRCTIAGFANDYHNLGGGTIIIGVREKDKASVGLSVNSQAAQQLIADICRDIIPPLAPEVYGSQYQGKEIIVVEIDTGQRRPYRAKGKCYIRIGPTTRQASFEEELELARRSLYVTFDQTIVKQANVVDLDMSKFKDYLRTRYRLGEAEYEDDRLLDMLKELRFLLPVNSEYNPTMAAILLFGKSPDRFYPQAIIDFGRFDGKDTTNRILNRQNVQGTLDDIVLRTQSIVEASMVTSSRFTEKSWTRIDIVEYPYPALREAILNAVMHRDYEKITVPIRVYMFDDRIEIISPGGLFGIVNKENFGTGIVDYRNPIIADTLRALGLVEKVGRGIIVIRKTMEENGSPEPIFELGTEYVKVILPAHKEYSAIRYYEKGMTCKDRGDIDQARTYMMRATEIDKKFVHAYFAWANLEADEDNIYMARELFRTAMQTDPKFEQVYAHYANLENRYGNIETAVSILEKGTKEIPDSAYLWHQRALFERNRRNFKASEKYYEKALALNSNDSRIWQSFGQLAMKERRPAEAEKRFRKALEFASSDFARAWIYNDLGRALSYLRRPQNEVEDCFRKAIQLGPRNPMTYETYAGYLIRNGQRDKGFEMRQKALDLGLLRRKKERFEPRKAT